MHAPRPSLATPAVIFDAAQDFDLEAFLRQRADRLFIDGLLAFEEEEQVAILILFAVCAEAMYTIFGRRVAGRISPISSTAYMCLYSAAMFLPFALWDLTNTDVMEVPVSTWLAIAYLAVFASGGNSCST